MQDLHQFLFEPVMRLLTSTRMLFPATGDGRSLLCRSLSQLLLLIVKHVLYSFAQDPERGKELVLPLVSHVLLSYFPSPLFW